MMPKLAASASEDFGELNRGALLAFFGNGCNFEELLLNFGAVVTTDVLENLSCIVELASGC